MQEVAGKADTLIRTTFSSVKPSLEWTHDEFDSGMCKDSPGFGDVTRRAAVMTEISEERRGALLGYIERAWRKAGYVITKVNSDKEFPAIYADADDGMLKMSLAVGYKGQFFLDVQTACVKKSTVAPPIAAAKGIDYYGKKIPVPNVRSEFWSSKESIRSAPPSGS